ncbi:MAG TPA: GNAT family protein [Streptosporangiaceae bacterium]|jgi:hypothetical protein
MSRRFPDDVPVLTDGAVTLRAHAPADLDGIVQQCTGAGLGPVLGDQPWPGHGTRPVRRHDGIELMHWRAVVGNWASRRIAWRCGFRLEGTVRMFGVHPDGAHDNWIGSLHRTEERKPGEPWPVEAAGS